MSTVHTLVTDRIAVVTLAREKVNAINGTLLEDINSTLDGLEVDRDVDAVVLTGRGKFFSFGFDVPELLTLSRDDLARFLTKFTDTLLRLFTFQMPIIAAVNGHATAGGCMLIMACDFRIAAQGRAKIGLNEIDLGVSVFLGSAEMLRYWAGNRNAELVLSEGTMYSVAQAADRGMIDVIVDAEHLMDEAIAKARELGGKPKVAYRALKKLARAGVTEKIAMGERAAIEAFIETWCSDEAKSILSALQIRK